MSGGACRAVRQGERFAAPAAVTLHSADFDFAAHAEAAAVQLAALPAGGGCGGADDAASWEKHYVRHRGRHFPMKNYLLAAFPELEGVLRAGDGEATEEEKDPKRRKTDSLPTDESARPPPPRPVLLECGCGTGSALLPLLAAGTAADVYAFDISATAVAQLEQHDVYKQFKTTHGDAAARAFTWDLAAPAPTALDGVACDYVLLLFTLSAVPPGKMAEAMELLAGQLRPGGLLFLRDYGVYDHAQMRFHEKHPGDVATTAAGRHVYRRGDGTQSYFFDKDEVAALAAAAGLRVVRNEYHCVTNVNRKNQQRMRKVFVNAVLRRPL